MADYRQHCEDCKKQLGKDWSVVHLWLDNLAWRTFPSKRHRMFRHHKEGVEEVRRKWGDQAANAAEIHIRRDLGDLPTAEEIAKRFTTEA